MTLTVKCPTCGKSVTWDDAHPQRPFCSKRCQLIDLGEWASENMRIPGEPQPKQSDTDEPPFTQ